MSRVRIAFLGTPEFAAICLRALLDDEHYEVVGVVSQPDRSAGRKMKLQPSAVKVLAQSRGVEVITPEKVSSPEAIEIVSSWQVESVVVVAYGQILSQKFLDIFPLGVVNVHGSLLPKWRGAAPIQRSIEAGERQTGVALQMVVKELDAGDVLGVRKVTVTDEMNSKDLYQCLAKLSCELLHVEYMDYLRGNLKGNPQNHSLATYARKIYKEESVVDWSLSAREIFNKIRAFVMGPGTHTTLNGKKVKLIKAGLDRESENFPEILKVGQVVKVTSESLLVMTGQGVLEILEIQPESRSRQRVSEFLKGHSIQEGDQFGG